MRQIEPAATRFSINAGRPRNSEAGLTVHDLSVPRTRPGAEPMTAPHAREQRRPQSSFAAPAGRLGFWFAAALGLVLTSFAGPAAAQETLVKNSDQGNRTNQTAHTGTHDQEFTTGPNRAGYRLTRVGIRIGDGGSSALLYLTLRRGGTTIANLTKSTPWVVGMNYATAPANTNLDPNTTYTIQRHA